MHLRNGFSCKKKKGRNEKIEQHKRVKSSEPQTNRPVKAADRAVPSTAAVILYPGPWRIDLSFVQG